MTPFKKILRLYGFGFKAKLRTYQRWYAGTPYEYVAAFVPEKGAIIDLGCGWGMFANLLALQSPLRRVHGLDLDEKKIQWAKNTVSKNRTNIQFEVKDLNQIELPQVDAIVLYDVLHHLEEPTQFKVLEQCFKKISPGGRLVLKENDTFPLWKLCISNLVEAIALGFDITLSKKILFRGRDEWVAILKTYGFVVTHVEHINTWYGFFVPHSLFICEKPS